MDELKAAIYDRSTLPELSTSSLMPIEPAQPPQPVDTRDPNSIAAPLYAEYSGATFHMHAYCPTGA